MRVGSNSSYLSRSNARALIFTPLIGDHNNWPVVEGTLPELGTKFGSPLRSVKYPRLKTIVHTSLELHDNDTHMFHSILVYDPLPSPLPKIARSLDGSLPLLQYLDESGSKVTTAATTQPFTAMASSSCSFSLASISLHLSR